MAHEHKLVFVYDESRLPGGKLLRRRSAGAPAQLRSLLIALEEVARRGLDARGITKRGKYEAARRVRDKVAAVWCGTPDAVERNAERWGASAEGMLRAIIQWPEVEQRVADPAARIFQPECGRRPIKEQQVIEALRLWRSRRRTTSTRVSPRASRQIHVIEFNLATYMRAEVLSEPVRRDSRPRRPNSG